MRRRIDGSGLPNAKDRRFRTRSCGNYMQPWTHGALYSTSDFDVGLNNGWALPNYRLLDPAVNIDYFEKELGRGSRRRHQRGRLQPARDRRSRPMAFFLEANGQLEILGNLRYNVGVRHIETDQFVSGYRHREHAGGRACVRSQRRLATTTRYLPSFNVASELGHGLVLRARGFARP